jgi:hypothetical protein
MWNAISDSRDSGKPAPVMPRDCRCIEGLLSAARTRSSSRSSLSLCRFAVRSTLDGYTHLKIPNAAVAAAPMNVPIPSGPQFLVIQCQKLPICSDYREWYSQRMPVPSGCGYGVDGLRPLPSKKDGLTRSRAQTRALTLKLSRCTEYKQSSVDSGI